MSIASVEGTSCCGMDELYGFDCPNDNTWLEELRVVYLGDFGELSPIIVFSGASNQTGRGTPFAFSLWLRKQGESVQRTRRVLNNNSGNKIQAFLWAPSAKFRKKFVAYSKKQAKEEEKENNGSRESIGWKLHR